MKEPNAYRATPLKRIWIPKPGRSELRSLSVPTYLDRSFQHLYNIVLNVLHKELAEERSFGFRPYRSPGWAAKAITLTCWKTIPKYAIELDISKCFDSISHEFILNHVSNIKLKQSSYQIIPNQIIKQWFKSGYIDVIGSVTPNDQLIPTEVGVPQGGPISPTISNIVLNCIEKAVDNSVRTTEYISYRQSIYKNTKTLWLKYGQPYLSTFNCLNQNDICFELSKAGLIELNSFQPRDLFRSKKYENYGLSFEHICFEKLIRPTPNNYTNHGTKLSALQTTASS